MNKAWRFDVSLVVIGALFIGFLSAAQGQEGGDLQKGQEELKQAAKSPAVEEELAEPDGVSVDLSDAANWKIIAIGTGTFEFNDNEERQEAMQEATLNAKAAMAKFLKERLQVSEQFDKLTEKESNKTKGSNGESSTAASKRVKTTLTTIRNSADEVFRGVLTLETTTKWSGNSGEVRVKVGQSQKTLDAAGKFGQRTRDSIKSDDAVKRDQAVAGPPKPNPGEELPNSDKRKNKSDF